MTLKSSPKASAQTLHVQVLSDPRQKRFFKSKDMRDLFTLGDEYAEASESAAIFAGIAPGVTIETTPEPALPEGAALALGSDMPVRSEGLWPWACAMPGKLL